MRRAPEKMPKLTKEEAITRAEQIVEQNGIAAYVVKAVEPNGEPAFWFITMKQISDMGESQPLPFVSVGIGDESGEAFLQFHLSMDEH